MADMRDFRKVSARLKSLEKKFGETKVDVTVGFTQTYSLVVHEDLEARHNVGQAKYLEQPAREMKKVFGQVILEAVKRGVKLGKAILFGGLRLQREAQQLTPVDTGALKASAFTCNTSEVEQVSKSAFDKSEDLRLSVLAARKGTP